MFTRRASSDTAALCRDVSARLLTEISPGDLVRLMILIQDFPHRIRDGPACSPASNLRRHTQAADRCPGAAHRRVLRGVELVTARGADSVHERGRACPAARARDRGDSTLERVRARHDRRRAVTRRTARGRPAASIAMARRSSACERVTRRSARGRSSRFEGAPPVRAPPRSGARQNDVGPAQQPGFRAHRGGP
jgi:hypothetical protein